MVIFFKKHILTLIGAVVGSLAGFLYWYWVGCESGNCMITSSPVISTLYGMLMGGLAFNLFTSNKKNQT